MAKFSSRFAVATTILALRETFVASTESPSTSPTANVGTSKWYANYATQRCLKDCPEGDGGECSGVTADTWAGFYDDAQACCSERFGYLDVDYCADRSLKVPLGTGKYYADTESGNCLQDTDPAQGAESSDKLYADIATCCKRALGWINSEYCESRSVGGAGFTGKWSVDYSSMVCKKDCAANATDHPECTPLDDRLATLFDDAESCCAGKLGWIDSTSCVTVSTTGKEVVTNGTDKYYADYANSPPRCAKDCEVVEGGDPECGGIIANSAGVQFFNDTATCCSAKFSWMDNGLCQAITTGASTGLWWVDYHSNSCRQDCPAVDNSPCGGSPPDLSMELFDDPMSCCSVKLGWVQAANCVTASTTGSAGATNGTMMFYADYQAGLCKKDCAVDAATPECGGVLESTTGLKMFSDSAKCCSSQFSWVDADLCAAMAAGGYTNKFYVSYADNSCKKDCAVDAASPECGGNPTDPASDMYLNATTCCKAVSWVDSATCVSMSENGVAVNETGSGKWYVDWTVVKCVKDCPISATAPECGGLAASWQVQNGGHDTAAECCSTQLSWVNATTCHL